MKDTTGHRDLEQRIEQLVREHIAAVQRGAREAIDRAFAGAAGAARKPAQTVAATAARSGKRRARAELSAVAERLYSNPSTNGGLDGHGQPWQAVRARRVWWVCALLRGGRGSAPGVIRVGRARAVYPAGAAPLLGTSGEWAPPCTGGASVQPAEQDRLSRGVPAP